MNNRPGRPNNYAKDLTHDFFMRMYVNELKTVNQIAKAIGCSKMTVSLYLNRHGIKRRNAKESAVIRWKHAKNIS